MQLKYLLPLLALTSTMATGLPVFARQPIIQRVYLPLEKVMDINIVPGVGTNINFEEVGETIQTMFLDNQSFVGLKPEGCLGTEDNCRDPANLIHITLLDKLKLPGVIKVNEEAVQSALTIRTKDKSGKKKNYIFNLKYARKTDVAVAEVTFVPPLPTNPVQASDPEADRYALALREKAQQEEWQQLTDKLFKGLKIATSKGEMNAYTPVQLQAVNNMIIAVHQGVPLIEAATKYSVDLNLVSKLILQGT
jgi:hypothetical protein